MALIIGEYRAVQRVFDRLLKCREGNFGLMAAILMPVLFAAGGFAFDFAQAVQTKYELQDAADAALLYGVSPNSSIMAATLQNVANGEIPASTAEIENAFRRAMRDNKIAAEIDIDKITLSKQDDGMLHAKIEYKASVPTTLGGIMGFKKITVAGVAAVSASLPKFRDYYVLLDNSPSMGVAATPEDIARMQQKTTGSCAFACHTTKAGTNNYQIARANKIKLRIDLLETATKAMVHTAEAKRAVPSQYRFAMYNLGTTVRNTQLTLFSQMAYPSKSLEDNVDSLQLMTLIDHGERGHAGTELYGAMSTLINQMGHQGKGGNSSDPIKTIIVVSDGLENSRKQDCKKRKVSGSGVCQEPLDNRVCEAAKEKGFDVAVLYTTYLPLPNDPWYNEWIKPFQGQIGGNLQTCASNGMFIQATFKDDLGEAMSELFKRTLGGSHLTQ